MKSLLSSLLIASLILSGSGCISNGPFGIRGEGPVVDRKLDLSTIKGITLPTSAKVYLTQGSEQEVRVTGQENILDLLNRDVESEIWRIDFKRPVWQTEPLKVYITLENLRSLKISGSGDVETVSRFTNQKDLEIRISGSGKVNLDMDARDIEANISGSGDLYLAGSANELDFGISGSGNINAFDLSARKANARISGSGGIELNAEDRLDAHISGSGSIFYKGDPKIDTSITGSGSVRSR